MRESRRRDAEEVSGVWPRQGRDSWWIADIRGERWARMDAALRRMSGRRIARHLRRYWSRRFLQHYDDDGCHCGVRSSMSYDARSRFLIGTHRHGVHRHMGMAGRASRIWPRRVGSSTLLADCRRGTRWTRMDTELTDGRGWRSARHLRRYWSRRFLQHYDDDGCHCGVRSSMSYDARSGFLIDTHRHGVHRRMGMAGRASRIWPRRVGGSLSLVDERGELYERVRSRIANCGAGGGGIRIGSRVCEAHLVCRSSGNMGGNMEALESAHDCIIAVDGCAGAVVTLG